ncbi:MAG: hypothetical protein ACFFFG_14940 [Candidatus Thorarchaeota archaeon]
MAEVDILMGSFFGILGIAFTLLTLLILRSNRNQINLTFGFSTILFGVSSFICMLAFYGFQAEALGFIGNIIMIWAPTAIFFAGKLILDGRDGAYRSPLAIVVFGAYLLFTIAYALLYFSASFQLSRSVLVGALIVSVALVLSAYVFGQIYQVSADSPDVRNKILFLILGLVIGFIGIISAFLSTNDILVPMTFASVSGLVINIGILLAGLAFTNIPLKIRGSLSGIAVGA